MRISVLTATDTLVRSVSALSLADSCPVLAVDLTEDGTTLTFSAGFDQTVEHVPLAHSCVSCSIREAIIPFLRAASPERVIVALPIAVEAATVVPTFAEQAEGLGWQMASVMHVCDVGSIAGELLSHVPLSAQGSALSPDDERCVGEVQMINIGYADVVVVMGTDPLGHELVEHFRPHDSLLIPSLSEVDAELLLAGRHSPQEALDRIHPATTSAWGGPTAQGVWTLDLTSDRAFHPDRLIDSLRDLCDGEVCVRGCFWLPTRPETVCAVNSHGGRITFGSAGDWPDAPRTHLIVTGTGERMPEIEAAFAACLLSTQEERGAFAWAGAPDGLGDYFD